MKRLIPLSFLALLPGDNTCQKSFSYLDEISFMKRLIPLSLLAILTLSGCSTPNETFDCPAGQGVGCRSISSVNQGIDDGSILKGEMAESGFNKQFLAPVISHVSPDTVLTGSLNPQEIVLSDKSVVQRGREEHLRVWIAPHADEDNNFHEGSIVHTILRPSYWHLQDWNFQHTQG